MLYYRIYSSKESCLIQVKALIARKDNLNKVFIGIIIS